MNEEMIEEVKSIPLESDIQSLEVNGEQLQGSITETQGKQPEDMAAVFFRMQAPRFKALLERMAPYQIRSAILNAVVYPLIDTGYNPESQEEREFAYLIHELMLNKVVMQLAFETQKAEEAIKKLDNNADLTTISEDNSQVEGKSDENVQSMQSSESD